MSGRFNTNTQWAWHYRTLVALRDHLVQQSTSPQTGDQFDKEFIRTLFANERDALGEIIAAIDRITQGRYGMCEHSGLPISATRLRAMPWARHDDGRPERGKIRVSVAKPCGGRRSKKG